MQRQVGRRHFDMTLIHFLGFSFGAHKIVNKINKLFINRCQPRMVFFIPAIDDIEKCRL